MGKKYDLHSSCAKGSWRRLVLLTLGTLALGSSGTALTWTAAQAQVQVGSQDQDIQDLVLEVRMGQAVITYGTVVFESEQRFYLPLIDIAESFEFVITDSDISRGYVEGWYISEDNTFSVDRENRVAFHKGKRIDLSAIDFVDDPYGENTDIFLQMEIFHAIWPEISFMVDMPTLTLVAQSDATFPFMERKERGARQKILEAKKAAQAIKKKELPYFSNPYTLIAPPVLDIETSFSWKHYDSQAAIQTSLNGTQDLAFMTAEYGLTFQRDENGYKAPDAMRLTLSRESTPDGVLPLGIKKVELGDTRASYREKIANSTGGRGFYFTTNERDTSREFDIITVEGNGPPGWEVELYRNNELIEFGTVDSSGEYRFEDIATQYGNNRLRVVLYGPQGQIREDVRDYNFAGNMLRPGQSAVTGALVDADRDFVPLVKENPRTTPRGIAKSLMGSFGLTRNITAFTTYSEIPVNEGTDTNEIKKYTTAGTVFSTGSGFGQVEAYKGIANGEAIDVRYLTQVLGFRLNLSSALYNKFESPDAGYSDNAKKREVAATISRNVRLPFGSLGLQFDAERVNRISGDSDTRFGTRQTLSRAGIQFANQTDTQIRNGHQTGTSGSLTANARMRNWRLRGGLGYTYQPQARINNANVELRYQTRDNFTAAVTLQNDFVQDLIGGGFQIGYDFKKFLGSFDANWLEDRGLEMMLRASTSLGTFSDDGGYEFASESQRNMTPVRGHVFLDRDLDGTFGEGDEPLQEARLNVGGRTSLDGTNESGYVVSKQGKTQGLINVAVDSSSLEDPYYVPATEGYSIALRQGRMPNVGFPVVETGAIDGTIYSSNDGTPVQGIRLQLVNEKGEIVALTEAAYDGFYTFEFVKPGTYTVQVDPSYQVNVPPMTVTVVSDDLFASGIDLELQEQAQETESGSTVSDADEASDLEDFNAEFEAAQDEEEAEGLTQVEPQSGAESGRVAQPYHETLNGTGEPAPHSSDGIMSAIVHRVRIGEYPDKFRLVMELSGPVNYEILAGGEDNEVLIDLADVAWDALTVWRMKNSPVISTFASEALAGDNGAIKGTRVRLKGRAAIRAADQGQIPPEGKGSYRLFLDFEKI